MGEGRRSPASPLRFQTSEGTLSLAAEEAQPPPDRRPGRSPLAVAALIGTSYAYLSPAEREVALGNSAGNYVLPTASAIQAGLKRADPVAIRACARSDRPADPGPVAAITE